MDFTTFWNSEVPFLDNLEESLTKGEGRPLQPPTMQVSTRKKTDDFVRDCLIKAGPKKNYTNGPEYSSKRGRFERPTHGSSLVQSPALAKEDSSFIDSLSTKSDEEPIKNTAKTQKSEYSRGKGWTLKEIKAVMEIEKPFDEKAGWWAPKVYLDHAYKQKMEELKKTFETKTGVKRNVSGILQQKGNMEFIRKEVFNWNQNQEILSLDQAVGMYVQRRIGEVGYNFQKMVKKATSFFKEYNDEYIKYRCRKWQEYLCVNAVDRPPQYSIFQFSVEDENLLKKIKNKEMLGNYRQNPILKKPESLLPLFQMDQDQEIFPLFNVDGTEWFLPEDRPLVDRLEAGDGEDNFFGGILDFIPKESEEGLGESFWGDDPF